MTKQKRHGGRNSEGASITDKVREREERDGLIRCGKSGNTVGVGQRILRVEWSRHIRRRWNTSVNTCMCLNM